MLFAQQLVNNGRICNQGVIKVAGYLESQGSGSGKDQGIDNKGILVVDGNAVIRQDTLLGRAEFVRDANGFIQIVPQITYASIYFSGISRKELDTSYRRSLVALDTFSTARNVEIALKPNYPIFSRGRVHHDGRINPATVFGRVILQGQQQQLIDGAGLFKELELDNSNGAAVINGGGFQVATLLDLKRGLFLNSPDNNFRIGSGALIRRSTEAGLAAAPIFDGTVSVEYYGIGGLVTGPEIPANDSALQDFIVRTTEPVIASASFTVNDTLLLQQSLVMELDPLQRYTLTYTPEHDPIFANSSAEIIGTIYRTRLAAGRPLLLNNVKTFVLFENPTDRGTIAALSSRVLPGTPPLPDNNQLFVQRAFELRAYDDRGAVVDTGFRLTFGYGWKLLPDDETNNLQLEEIALHRWDGTQWVVVGESDTAQVDSPWAFGRAKNVDALGYLALGPRGEVEKIYVNIRVFLEGAYAQGEVMKTWLKQLDMIPKTPPNYYPYNLDPQRPFLRVEQIPDSVVDWVVVELRSEQSGGERMFKTGFLRYDGLIVDLDGRTPIRLNAGSYYIVIHHRNHLAVMTKDLYEIRQGTAGIVDLTKAQFLYGGSNAAKVVDVGLSGYVYAMIGGDVNGDGKVDRDDYDASPSSSWQARNLEGYLNADSNLDGIITTRDVNLNWNNRGRFSLVP